MSHETPPTDPTPIDTELDTERPSEEFARALQEYEKSAPAVDAPEATVGAKVHARIVSIGDGTALADFGGRSEGAIDLAAYRNDDGTLRLAVGDELDLFVVESGDQIVLAPTLRADPGAALAQLREAQSAGVPVSGKVTAVNTGGLAVDLAGVRGFCPVSQIELGFCADPAQYVGRTLEFLVTSVEDGKGSAVVSRRALLRRAEQEEGKKMLAELKVGDERDGRVRRLEAFGAFIDLGGVDGLAHISEISHAHIGHPRDVLKVGEKVRVRVLKIGTGKDGRPKLALSVKAALPDPWADVVARFTVGARVQGTVARLAEFGAFVTLAPGVDGLVHVSQVALHRVVHAKEVLSPGQQVEAIVLGVEPDKKRISLSIREALAASLPPARTPETGEIVEGRVGSIKPFGVFVDLPSLGARASGLMPREETGHPRGTDLAALFKVGDPIRVEILESKEGKLRLRLEGATPVVEDRPARPAGEPRGERGPRSDRGGDRGPRADRGPRRDRGPREERGATSWSTPTNPNEPTTMALALRKAMEAARRKQAGSKD